MKDSLRALRKPAILAAAVASSTAECLRQFGWLRMGRLHSLLILLLFAVYRLFFSRISHIPKPKLAALSYYYQSWYDVYPRQGRFFWKCKELHQRHGSVVRIGPHEVHVHQPDAYTEMYGSQKHRRDKSAVWFWMVGTGEFGDPSIFTTLPHDLHRM